MIKFAAVPASELMELALTVPEVWPSSVLRTDAVSEVSVRVTASLPRLLMPEEA